jgi:hypothetical protein
MILAMFVFISSASQTFTLSNIGGGNLQIREITLANSYSDFTIENDNCSNVSLAASETCTVDILFVPDYAGEESNTLIIPSYSLQSPFNVSLMGAAIESGITVKPSHYEYGTLSVGESSLKTFTVSNDGDTDIQIEEISISGDNSGEFGKQNDACSGNVLTSVGSCTVDVVFFPTSEGAKEASLSISFNGVGSPVNVLLTGKGDNSQASSMRIKKGIILKKKNKSGKDKIKLIFKNCSQLKEAMNTILDFGQNNFVLLQAVVMAVKSAL